MWPFSTLGWPNETSDLARYFPTDTLVTGYDIIPFWVARMMFTSEYTLNKTPFKYCLIHGLIRDELGRKVSKSLGNGIDILEAFEKYGVDSMRYFLTTSSTPGQDMRYSTEKIEASWNYINKIWNISRFIGLNFENFNYQNETINKDLLTNVDKWILYRLNETIRVADYNFEKFEFGEASKAIYKFTWSDFASWYLEMTKVTLNGDNQELKINTCAVLKHCLTAILKLLHPFMPFFTEEIYQMYNDSSIVISDWPLALDEYDFKESNIQEILFDVITAVRNIRASKNVPNSKKIDLLLQAQSKEVEEFLNNSKDYLLRFTNFDNLTITTNEVDKKKSMVEIFTDVTVVIPLDALVDVNEELKKLEETKKKLLSEIARCKGMLANPNFTNKAPKEKVQAEVDKLANYEKQFAEVEKSIKDLM